MGFSGENNVGARGVKKVRSGIDLICTVVLGGLRGPVSPWIRPVCLSTQTLTAARVTLSPKYTYRGYPPKGGSIGGPGIPSARPDHA